MEKHEEIKNDTTTKYYNYNEFCTLTTNLSNHFQILDEILTNGKLQTSENENICISIITNLIDLSLLSDKQYFYHPKDDVDGKNTNYEKISEWARSTLNQFPRLYTNNERCVKILTKTIHTILKLQRYKLQLERHTQHIENIFEDMNEIRNSAFTMNSLNEDEKEKMEKTLDQNYTSLLTSLTTEFDKYNFVIGRQKIIYKYTRQQVDDSSDEGESE